MEPIRQLGAEIESLWLEKNYNEENLPAIAADALRRADLPSIVSAWDVVEWALEQNELPPQRDPHGNFGDPPITVYSGPRFHIDVYFWFEGTTAIHQHGFCGAFQVMMGSSIHSWYEFERNEAINAFFETGDMSLRVCEILDAGAVQEIRAGRQYIHSLFHLEQPSATIVVRTDRSPLHLPQFSYYKPGLAVDPFFEQNTTAKKLQTLTAAVRAKHPESDRMIAGLLAKSDIQTSFVILSQIRQLLRGDRLGQFFNAGGARSRFDEMVEVAAKRHPEMTDLLRSVFERQDIIDEIVSRRSYVTNPEHRFFMALLLNVDGRERILDLIGKRFPGSDPIEKVLDWVFDLAQTRVVGIDNLNALGIPEFGEPEMQVLEAILRGSSDEQISASMAVGDDGSTAAAISKVRAAVIFRPLLV